MNTVPTVWFSPTAPTAVYPNNVYIWEETGYLQLGIAAPFPISTGGTDHALVTLTSLDNGAPDAGLYTNVIRKVVAAYKTGLLRLEWSPTLDVLLEPVPSAVANDLTTVKDSYIIIRYDFSTTPSDTVTLSLRITDTHGFVMARNEAIILTDILVTPTPNEDSLDVFALPPSTAPVSQAGNFSAASPTLLPVKTLATTTAFDSIQAYWYGVIPEGIPPSFDCKQLAIWKDANNLFQYAIVLPLDEVLTKPTIPLVKGTIAGVPSTAICFTNKWWHVTMLTSSLPYNGNTAFLSKVLLAVNDGVLFLSERILEPVGSSPPTTSHPIPNSITINMSIIYGNRHVDAIGDYYGQYLALNTYDETGKALSITSESVRIDCPDGNVSFFPSDAIYFGGVSCAASKCGNTYQMGQLAAHGPNNGINVLQGRGGIPTGTELSTGTRVSYWDLVRAIITNTALLYTNPFTAYIHDTLPNDELYIPYLGLERSIHSNHPARAVVLGYSHYHYPDIFHPLDIGRSTNFGVHVAGATYSTFVSTKTAIVADDDALFAVTESNKNKCVFLCRPNYNDTYPTRQLDSKTVDFYLPNSTSQYTQIVLDSDPALTLDLSAYRKMTPLFNVGYGTPTQEHNCSVALVDGDVVFNDSVGTAGGNQFIGFSASFNEDALQVTHGLILPSPSTTVTALTAITNYPEFGVPFTTDSPSDIIGASTSPYAPKFVGLLPPNYKMLWVDWTSITATDITIYYWMSPERYDLDTVYTTAPPTVDQAISRTLTLTPSASSVMTFDGNTVFSVEVAVDTWPYATLRIFAGDVLIAEDTTGDLPWINTGSVFFHGHGDTNLDDVSFTNVNIVPGAHVNPLDGKPSVDYVELQVEEIGFPITQANYATLDLKPYTLYWNPGENALYMPVLRDTSQFPTQLAKILFFSNQPSNPFLLDLLDNGVPNEHVYLSNNHGLTNVPYLSNSEVFTSDPISAEDTHVVYYWRTGTDYATIIGPMVGQIVPGVTVPVKVGVPDNGATSVLDGSTVDGQNNLTFIGSAIVINGVDNGTAYGKFPLRLEDPSVDKYTIQFTRIQQGTWQSDLLTYSNFGLYLFPSRPDWAGIPEFPLMPKPQIRNLRVLFPAGLDSVAVQTSSYRGYTWNTAVSGVGSGVLVDTNGGSVIAVEVTNKNGFCELRVYENQQPKYVALTDVPYFNNGCIALALTNGGYQSTETIDNLEVLIGGPKPPQAAADAVVYCVPTTSISDEFSLVKDVERSLLKISAQMKYAYVDYTVSNAQLATATVEVYMTQGDSSDATLIDTIIVEPTQTITRKLRYMHRGEKLMMVSNVDGIKVRVVAIVQL